MMATARAKKTYLAVGAVFLLLLGLHYFGLLQTVEGAMQSFTVPLLKEVNGLSVEVGDNYQFFKSRSDFIEAYKQCVATTEKGGVNDAKLLLLTDENDQLKQQLNYFQKATTTHLLANVIGREVLTTDQTFIIDEGAPVGIKVDDPVIAGDGILVGKVAKVDDKISVIRLLNDNQSRAGATILNHQKSLGVVEGGFGISLKMNLIPRDEIVLVGDQVVTSGLEGSIPRGLLIGTVTVVENEPYKPFQQAILTPATDLAKLSIVSVLLTK